MSITSLFSVKILSHLGVSHIIYSDVIDSFISEILKNESSVFVFSTEKPWAVLFTPLSNYLVLIRYIVFVLASDQEICG